MITVSLILKIISLFIAVLCLILIEIDKERHILNTKMKTIIAILGILAFIYSLYVLWKLIILMERGKIITISLILKIISFFIAVLCLILIEIDKERHILNTKMKTIIAILGILAFIYSLYVLWKLIILMERGKIITISLILKIISFFIAVLCLILIEIDKERHILNTKMKTIIAILGILAFIYSLYILWKIITLIRK